MTAPINTRDVLILDGIVLAEHRGDHYDVDCEIENGGRLRVLARRAGKLVKSHIRILAGDVVRVEVSPYDLRRGRIVWRDRGTAS